MGLSKSPPKSDLVRLIHWSSHKAITQPSLRPPYVFPKPFGALWLSPGTVWIEWLAQEMPDHLRSLKYRSEVVLHTKNLLRVTPANYKAITKEYGVLMHSEHYEWYCLDWNKIATAGYQGIDCLSIPDFQAVPITHGWLHQMDVPCVAVWDPRAIIRSSTERIK